MLPRTLAASRLFAALALLMVFGCKSATDACDPSDPFCGSSNQVPTTISLNPGAVTLTAVGETRQLVPTVLDQNGQTISGASITWLSDNTSVVTVSNSGLLHAVGNGTTQVHATSGSATAAAGISVCVFLGNVTFGSASFEGLSATDCVLSTGVYADFWTLQINGATEGLVQVDLLSANFDTYLGVLNASGTVLAENDDHDVAIGAPFYDLSSRVTQTLTTGTYTIVATSYDPQVTGTYQLSAGPGLLCPEEGLIAVGSSTTGQSLEATDCSYDQYYADVYVVRVQSATTVTMTLTSTDFDAYLTLLDPSGNVVFNDDDGAGGTDAQISRSLTPAWYVVEVSSAFTNEFGAYTLTIN